MSGHPYGRASDLDTMLAAAEPADPRPLAGLV